MKRVIVESPFRGENSYQQERNERYALECMKDSIARGEAPFLSHLLYTKVFNERILEEREYGIDLGLVWGECAEITAVYTDNGISAGMQTGINHAEKHGRIVEYRKLASSSELEKFHKSKLNTLLTRVSAHFQIPVSDLKGKSRTRDVIDARHVFCSVAKDLYPKCSYKEIGAIVDREHSTVMNAISECHQVREKKAKYDSFCLSSKMNSCLPSLQN